MPLQTALAGSKPNYDVLGNPLAIWTFSSQGSA
jgi:hypothetical protein